MPFALPAVGMRRAVEHLEQRFDRADGRIVVVLPNGGERFGPALHQLLFRETRAPRDVQTIARTSAKSSDRHVQESVIV